MGIALNCLEYVEEKMVIAFGKFFNTVNSSQRSPHPVFFSEVRFLLDLELVDQTVNLEVAIRVERPTVP